MKAQTKCKSSVFPHQEPLRIDTTTSFPMLYTLCVGWNIEITD
jgi:hypothetical protein